MQNALLNPITNYNNKKKKNLINSQKIIKNTKYQKVTLQIRKDPVEFRKD